MICCMLLRLLMTVMMGTMMCMMVQYIVVPTRRASATAVQTLMQHALGDAISPYLIGLVSSLRHHISPASRRI